MFKIKVIFLLKDFPGASYHFAVSGHFIDDAKNGLLLGNQKKECESHPVPLSFFNVGKILLD